MPVKRKGDGNVTSRFQSSEFWATREALLREHLERGTGLREAAILIGATYPATEAKARRLGIWPRRKSATEPARTSEWVLAGYGGEEEARLSGALQSGSDLTSQALIQHPVTGDVWVLDKTTGRMVGLTRAEEQAEPPAYLDPVDAAEATAGAIDLTPHALILEHPDPAASRHLTKSEQRTMKRALRASTRPIAKGGEAAAEPIAADSRGEEKPVGGGDTECWFCPICRTMTLLTEAEAGKCCVEPRRQDCPTRLMVLPSKEGRFDTDQIPSKRKRSTRSKPPKPVFSTPVEEMITQASRPIEETVAQLDAVAAAAERFFGALPTPALKRAWDFPPSGGCLFPFGDVGRPGFKFCAEPVAGTGIPYCPEHIRRVYGRGIAREEVD